MPLRRPEDDVTHEPVSREPASASGIVDDSLVVVVKSDCPTCQRVVPVLEELSQAVPLSVHYQDDGAFLGAVDAIDDRDLECSRQHQIDTVPTVLRLRDGSEVDRAEGWFRADWERVTGVAGLGAGLVDHLPGCGSRIHDPDVADAMAERWGSEHLSARRVPVGSLEDEVEACVQRGWSDGLPVVPPTVPRVARMLEGSDRSPGEVLGVVPPALVECTVEKAAINAVLAGCAPAYLPVVLTAVEALCRQEFNALGTLGSTDSISPIVIANGPITRSIGMNSGANVLGQGNRANATIGRALQLIVRNVGGGRPGEIDRATFGNPGKITFCFAEDEEGSPWPPLSVSRGVAPQASAVTLFAGEGVSTIVDQAAREPEPLARSFAAAIRTVGHPKLAQVRDVLLVVSPLHGQVFREGAWSREALRDALVELTKAPARELIRGAGGMAEGMEWTSVDGSPGGLRLSSGDELTAEDDLVRKFRPEQILITHAGAAAGAMSSVVGGWLSGDAGSSPVTQEVR